MMTDRGKLSSFLSEVISWNWLEFCQAEMKVGEYSGYQSTVFSLVRACSEAKLGAIKLSIDRIDGKLETPIKIEYPKVYFLYPYAENAASPGIEETAMLPGPVQAPIEPEPEVEVEPDEESAATLSLRQMVDKMADQPKELVPLILHMKAKVEKLLAAGEIPEDSDLAEKKIPLVKSVIAANLLHLAIEKNNFDAITEVFDQIEGKLVETIKVLADDVYLVQYALEAPAGAVKNRNGVYQIEAKEIANQWQEKLKSSKS